MSINAPSAIENYVSLLNTVDNYLINEPKHSLTVTENTLPHNFRKRALSGWKRNTTTS